MDRGLRRNGLTEGDDGMSGRTKDDDGINSRTEDDDGMHDGPTNNYWTDGQGTTTMGRTEDDDGMDG